MFGPNKKYFTKKELMDKYCADAPCKKIFEKLHSSLESETNATHHYRYKKQFSYNELCKLTKAEMSEPTLIRHLKHLQGKGCITRKAKDPYHTSYRFNIELELLIRISRKEKHMFVPPNKIRIGDKILTPMHPFE